MLENLHFSCSGLTLVSAFTFVTVSEIVWGVVPGRAAGGRRAATRGDGVVSSTVVPL